MAEEQRTLLDPPLGRVVDTGPEKGLGVVAVRDIAAGEVIETAPTICFPGEPDDFPDGIRDRVFGFDDMPGYEHLCAIALGYGSLYNHANPANMGYAAEHDASAIIFTAARDIAAGEELTINYDRDPGGDPDVVESSESRWFGSRGIEPV